jgi:hypothetical protein
MHTLINHLIKLIDNHVAEVAGGVLPVNKLPRVIQLERIRDGQDFAGSSFQPNWLIVTRPIHAVRVAGLLKEIERDIRLGGRRTQPSFRLLTFVSFNRCSYVFD